LLRVLAKTNKTKTITWIASFLAKTIKPERFNRQTCRHSSSLRGTKQSRNTQIKGVRIKGVRPLLI